MQNKINIIRITLTYKINITIKCNIKYAINAICVKPAFVKTPAT